MTAHICDVPSCPNLTGRGWKLCVGHRLMVIANDEGACCDMGARGLAHNGHTERPVGEPRWLAWEPK